MSAALPVKLLDGALCALRKVDIEPAIIGSLAALEHLDVTAAASITTEDVDLLLQLDGVQQVVSVERAMSSLGLQRPDGRDGKWLPADGDIGIDLLSRSSLSGFGPPACLHEPFANVAALDLCAAKVLGARIALPVGYSPTTMGPLTAVMGKALKVSRYLGLDDWAVNAHRRYRARRSMWIAAAIVHQNPGAFAPEPVVELLARAESAGAPVPTTLARGARATLRLLGAVGAEGFKLARGGGPDGIWDPSVVAAALVPLSMLSSDSVRW